jgi:uncharacterized protein YjbI with pentapeptide repeats
MAGREQSEVRYSVLSVKAIWWAAGLIVLVGVGVAVWLLLTYGGGGDQQRNQLDAIKTAGTIVVGTGGAAALLLAARRQRTAEIALKQKDRDQADVTRAHALQERIAAENRAHQERVAAATEADAAARRITELYTKAVEQLGSAQAPVRLGGLYALERLAQDNPDQRQTIVNVLCAYLRMPYTPPSASPRRLGIHRALQPKHTRITANRNPEGTTGNLGTSRQEMEVRLTAQRILAKHLHPGPTPTEPLDDFWQDIDFGLTGATGPAGTFWQDIDLDLTGATLIDFDLSNCGVHDVRFNGARFRGDASFNGARFSGDASFETAQFTGEAVFFEAQFRGDARFAQAKFSGAASFGWVQFSGEAWFSGAQFSGEASFERARFRGSAYFARAKFGVFAEFEASWFGDNASFDEAEFCYLTSFKTAQFCDTTSFKMAQFSGEVEFGGVIFGKPPHLGGVRFEGPEPAEITAFLRDRRNGTRVDTFPVVDSTIVDEDSYQHGLATANGLHRRSELSTETAPPTKKPTTQSIKGEWPSASVQEFVVQVYLESQDGASEVDQGVLGVLRGMNAELGFRPPPVIDSWFRKFRATVERTVESDPFSDLTLRVERALEMKALHEPQAQIDSAEAGAAADLIRSLDRQKNALVQIGSLLLIKVDGNLVVRNLTQRELAFIQRNPASSANAKDILGRLQGLSAEDLRTAAIERSADMQVSLEMPEAESGCAALTGKIWTSGQQHRLEVTNDGAVPVRNVWAVVEGSTDQHALRILESDIPLSLLMPGQSAMLDIVGNKNSGPVSVALCGEGPVGETLKCVIKVEL